MALNVLEAHSKQQQQQSTQPQQAGSSSTSSPINFGEPQAAQWTAEQLHLGIEACRLAFADALAWVADPLVHEQPLQQLMSAERAMLRYLQYFKPDQVRGHTPRRTAQVEAWSAS
jgi:gamma-glutamyltranspeptidase